LSLISNQLESGHLSENKKEIIVVACIPAYNEERNIAKAILQVQRYVGKVIVCDDGSTDMTSEIAEKLGAIVLRHSKNMGYGAALATLFSAAEKVGADALVTIDGDGQHDTTQIPKLLEPLRSGDADLVIGSRFQRREDAVGIPGYRKFGLEMINGLAKKLTYDELTDAQSGFRAYNRRAIKLLRPMEKGMGASTEILLKARDAGLMLKEVPTRMNYNKDSSTHNPFVHGFDVVLSTVKQASMRRPLLFYGVPGILSLLTALVFWIWTFQIFAVTKTVITNIALIAVGGTIMGLMLMTTAVILWVIIGAIRENGKEVI